MKINKAALRSARQLLRVCVDESGRLQSDRIRKVVKRVGEAKPRGYLAILTAFQRLVGLEIDKKNAIIESAVELAPALQNQIRTDLQKKYGDDLTFDYSVNPALLGGLRVKMGSHVWDGSVRAKLEALRQSLV